MAVALSCIWAFCFKQGSRFALREDLSGMDNQLFLLGIAWYAVFVFSTVCHEFAHAWSANRLGDPSARAFITLNPLPHIMRSPFGMVVIPLVLFIVSKGGWMFGYASVPISVAWALGFPKRYAFVSLCGPLANLALLLVSVGGLAALVHSGALTPDTMNSDSLDTPAQAGAFVLSILLKLNLILLVFNLIPLPPMDGAALPAFFIPRQHLQGYFNVVWAPYAGLAGLIMAYYIFPIVMAEYAYPLLKRLLWLVL